MTHSLSRCKTPVNDANAGSVAGGETSSRKAGLHSCYPQMKSHALTYKCHLLVLSEVGILNKLYVLLRQGLTYSTV